LLLLLSAAAVQILMQVLGHVWGRFFLRPTLGGLRAYLCVVLVVGAVCVVAEVAGYVLCLFVPDEGCRKLAIGVLVVSTAWTGASVGIFVDPVVREMAFVEELEVRKKQDQAALLGELAQQAERLAGFMKRVSLLALFLSLVNYARLILIPFFLKVLA